MKPPNAFAEETKELQHLAAMRGVPPRACLQQPCIGLAEQGGRCAKHRQLADRIRGSSAARGYDFAGEKHSDLKIATDPISEIRMNCQGSIATEVDHIIPFRSKDDPLRLDRNNLQSACKPCNSAKARPHYPSGNLYGVWGSKLPGVRLWRPLATLVQKFPGFQLS